jgi:hypothetical protein
MKWNKKVRFNRKPQYRSITPTLLHHTEHEQQHRRCSTNRYPLSNTQLPGSTPYSRHQQSSYPPPVQTLAPTRHSEAPPYPRAPPARHSQAPFYLPPGSRSFQSQLYPLPPQSSLPLYLNPSPHQSAMNGRVILNPLLGYASPQCLKYSLVYPAPELPEALVNASAFNPSAHEITIVSRYIPWVIRIHPRTNLHYVTVRDVLLGLYDSLHRRATAGDYYALPTLDEQIHVKHAFERRYRSLSSRSERAREKMNGLKRIDFLKHIITFCGLSYMSSTEISRVYRCQLHIG